MLHRHVLAASLTLGLLSSGCSGGGTPPATPTTSVTTAATTSVETTTTPTATSTETPAESPEATASGTPSETASGTPTAEETLDPAYVKLKEEGINLALGKGYAEAVPALDKALEVKPDDPEVHFYLMLSQGNLEETPTPKSPAYGHAKKVLELAPGSTMAERARDYILSAESEPKKPMPDLPADPIGPPTNWLIKPNALYTMEAPVYMIPDMKFGDDLIKELWYLELVPNSVTAKVQVPKGTQFTVRSGHDAYYGKTSWRGGKARPEEFDTNMYQLAIFEIEIESGEMKGKRGWYVNQLDRFLGVDEKEAPVFGVKIGPRLNVGRDGK